MLDFVIKNWGAILGALIVISFVYLVFLSNLFLDDEDLSEENLGDY